MKVNKPASKHQSLKTVYAVSRLDSSFIGKDIFGAKTVTHLPKGHYAMPVFDSLTEAEEYADGRFEIMEMQVFTNEPKKTA